MDAARVRKRARQRVERRVAAGQIERGIEWLHVVGGVAKRDVPSVPLSYFARHSASSARSRSISACCARSISVSSRIVVMRRFL